MSFSVKLDNGTSIGLNNICFPIPSLAKIANLISDDEDSQKEDRPYNPSVDMSQLIFCNVVNHLPIGCMIKNFLEQWDFNEFTIKNLTKDDILNTLHTSHRSLTTGHEANFQSLLGGVTRNETGHIVAARALVTHWMVHVNFSAVDHNKVGNAAGTEDWVSEEAFLWENKFLNSMETLRDNLSDAETQIHYSAGRR